MAEHAAQLQAHHTHILSAAKNTPLADAARRLRQNDYEK